MNVLLLLWSTMILYSTGAYGVLNNLRDDVFNIYKKVAIVAREVEGTNVTSDDVTYYLYTKKNPDNYIKLNTNKLDRLADNPSVKIVFFIHGWINSRDIEWYEDLKNAFLAKDEEYYVVQIDWSRPASDLYTISSINTYDVAKLIAKLIQDLNKNYEVDLQNILIIGHSLGGQICGFIGKIIYKETGKKLPRIVALDPAGPLFSIRPDDKRLNKEDADVVQVVHTDGGTFGYLQPCGTIDFYVNGGETQPGCSQMDLADLDTIPEPLWCDHHRAYEYYTEAILNPTEFVAKKCSSWENYKNSQCEKEEVAMGDLTTTLTGNFYLETNKDKPFAKRLNGQSKFVLVPITRN